MSKQSKDDGTIEKKTPMRLLEYYQKKINAFDEENNKW